MIYIGGETQLEAATNYPRILSKINNNSLKVTPEKMHIFLKSGIILLSSALRHPNTIYITPDNSPGFSTLVRNQDKELQKLKTTFIKTDELNNNAKLDCPISCSIVGQHTGLTFKSTWGVEHG